MFMSKTSEPTPIPKCLPPGEANQNAVIASYQRMPRKTMAT